MGRLLDLAAAALCIGAGVYLLQYNAAQGVDGTTSWFQIIGHGMGIYFIGKGLFIGRSLHLASRQATSVEQILNHVEASREEHIHASTLRDRVSDLNR